MKNLILLIALFSIMIFTPSCTQELTVLDSNDNGTQRTNSPHISITEALQNADKVFARLEPRTRSIRTVKSIEVFGGRQTRSESDTTAKYYLVNYENDGGFAVLSADERIGEVFAIGEEGNLSKEDTVGNLGLTLFFNGVDAISENIEYVSALSQEFGKDTTVNLLPRTVPPMVPKPVAMWHGKLYDDEELNFLTRTVLACQIAATFSWPKSLEPNRDYYNPHNAKYANFNWSVIRDCWFPENDERAYMCDYYKDAIELFKLMNTYFDYGTHLDFTFDRIGYKAEMITQSSNSDMHFAAQTFWGSNYNFKNCLDEGKIILAHNNSRLVPYSNNVIWIIDGYIYDPSLNNQYPLPVGVDIIFHCVWGDGKKHNGYFMFIDPKYIGCCSMNTNPVMIDNPSYFEALEEGFEEIGFYKISPKKY